MAMTRDTIAATTPMRCPICGGELQNVLIREIGGVTAKKNWYIHAGECPEHGWFQAEVISRPPHEIFPVTHPFGTTRRVVVNGKEIFAFPTVWSDLPPAAQRQKVDPLDPKYWQVSARDRS